MSKMKQTLVLVSGRSLDVAHLSSLIQDDRSINNCVFCDSNAIDTFPESTFEKALCFIRESLEILKLSALRKSLVPGAVAEFHGAEEPVSLRRNCLMSSFFILESDSEEVLKVKKPDWNVGAKSAISSNTTWTVSPDDEILDDDDFLTEEDLKPPVLEGRPPQLSLVKIQDLDGKQPVKKACENCTCGRAEGKEPVKLTREMLDNPVTSCGSCGLGDAYRCASCPYRGLPAFEPGKKIQLPEDFLVSDI